jgi:3',5'-cyclic AMP phosphodiesterase CpdA
VRKNNIFLFLALILVILSAASVWAVPLSLDGNIQAILSKSSGIEQGFDFIVLGDMRGNDEVYSRLLNKARDYKPLFILNTGDMVHRGGEQEFENYKKLIADIDIPILHVPGNHDVLFGSGQYRNFVGPLNWYFDFGNYRFLGLDNAAGKFSEDDIAFSKRTLTDKKTCLVAFHNPPPFGRWAVHAMKPDEEGGRGGEVIALMKQARVPLVFMGHIHLFDEMEVDGIKYVISAGGGAKLYGRYGFGKAEYGFVLVEVRPQGISYRWIPLENQ